MNHLRQLILATGLSVITLPALAEVKEYIRDYEYQATKYDSQYTARLNAIDGVKRTLLEEIGTYVQSVVNVKQDDSGKAYMAHDMVTLTAGIMKMKLLQEQWKQPGYFVKASMHADSDEVLKAMRELRENFVLQNSLRESLNELNEARQKINELKQALLNNKGDELAMLKDYNSAQQEMEAEQRFQDALRLLLTGDFNAAFSQMTELAEQGNAKGQARLGLMYERGIGMDADYSKALEWYQKAVKNGSAFAQARIGFMYERGFGVQRDESRAADYFRQAIDRGNKWAYGELGYLYQTGQGVPRDLEKAVEYYKKGSEAGNGFASARLGAMYEMGLEVSRDHDRARKLYEFAIEKGNSYGMARRANMYLREGGYDAEAYRLASEAVRRGNPSSYGVLGQMYEEGRYVDQDYGKAVENYRKGVEQDGTNSQFRLGRMYLKGLGVEKDRQEGVRLLRLAADKGHPKAQEILDKVASRRGM